MKHTFFFLFAATLLSTCTSEPKTFTPAQSGFLYGAEVVECRYNQGCYAVSDAK